MASRLPVHRSHAEGHGRSAPPPGSSITPTAYASRQRGSSSRRRASGSATKSRYAAASAAASSAGAASGPASSSTSAATDAYYKYRESFGASVGSGIPSSSTGRTAAAPSSSSSAYKSYGSYDTYEVGNTAHRSVSTRADAGSGWSAPSSAPSPAASSSSSSAVYYPSRHRAGDRAGATSSSVPRYTTGGHTVDYRDEYDPTASSAAHYGYDSHHRSSQYPAYATGSSGYLAPRGGSAVEPATDPDYDYPYSTTSSSHHRSSRSSSSKHKSKLSTTSSSSSSSSKPKSSSSSSSSSSKNKHMASTAPARVSAHGSTDPYARSSTTHTKASSSSRSGSWDSTSATPTSSSRSSSSSVPAEVLSAHAAVRAAAGAGGGTSASRFDPPPSLPLSRKSSTAELDTLPPPSKGSGPRGLVGLHNLGNTCFMNSVLQSLSNIPELTYYFYSGAYRRDINKKSHTKGRLADAYGGLIQRMWRDGSSSGAERPAEVKSVVGKVASRFMGYDQQDAQEFLRFFLDALHEDTNRVTEKAYQELKEKPSDSDSKVSRLWWDYYCKRNDSVVKELFAGQLRSAVTCSRCNYVSRCFDPFWDLSVPIPKSAQVRERRSGGMFGSSGGGGHETCGIESCLEAFITPEVLRGAECWHCPKCKRDTESTKEMSIFRLPNVLVLHIKRFSFSTFRRTKLSTNIRFPVQKLDMLPYCAESSPERSGKGPSPIYNLVAISNHMGGLGGGHYTADCLNADDQQWHNYNDSRVSGSSPSRLSESSSYLLFYLRQGS